MNKKIRVIARGSRLSRLQVEEVFKNFPELAYEIKYLESYGDKNQQISLLNGEAPADIFTRELDDAIRQGDADIAIHSAKDLPYPLPEDIEVIALFPAFDTTDSLVSRDHKKLAELPAGSIIGTSSPLRKKGLNELRPDLTIKGIRGCIEERVQQVKDGKYDAAIVATCALKRLGMEDEIAEVLPFPTHPLQGFLAITALKESAAIRNTGGTKVPADLQSDGKQAISSQALKQAFASKSILDKQGTVSLVGFGPGDPELLTIKAAKAIDAADIIFYDDLIDDSYLADKKAEKIYVGKRAGYHHKEQADINRLLLEAAREGKNVVRLKGGDPMIFAHGSEEIEYLESNLIKVNVIPGITTASALAASQKISLTHRDFSSSVALVSGHTPQPVTPDAETLVYYMGAKQLQTIATQLIDKEGWAFNTPVLLTYNVSRPDEQTFETTLWNLRNGEMQNLPTPLIALIGNVAGLKHHQASDIKPTLYTGTLPAIEKRKTDYTYTPLIEINYEIDHEWGLEDIGTSPISKEWYDGEWADGLEDYSDISYLLFTSQYAVKGFMRVVEYTNYQQYTNEDLKVISIGKTTTEALHKAGFKDVIQVDEDNRYGIIEWFKKERPKFLEQHPIEIEHGEEYEEIPAVLYPCSSLSPDDIPEALFALRYNVTKWTVYNNELPKNPRRVNLNHFKRIVFTSPSTIDNFIKLYGKLPENTEFITRGPITQAHLEEVLNK
jgi:uroporphyrinogen III methyltransferase/synthase